MRTRACIRRALRAAWALPLLAALAVAACNTTSAAVTGPVATVAGSPPTLLGGAGWQRIALPAPLGELFGFAVSPADPATMLACSSASVVPAPLTLWRTTDTGAHWTRYLPLAGVGTACNIAFAQDDPRRVTVQVAESTSGRQPCADDTFYLSGDGGQSWKRLPPHTSIAPAQVGFGWCDLHVTRDHLFLAYSFGASTAQSQVSLLERSDDDGVSWVRADNGLGAGALFFMPQIGPGERLALTVVHLPDQPGVAEPPTELWTSADAGATWSRAGALPEHPGTFLLSSLPAAGSTWPTAEHPFYTLEEEQIPSDLYRERVLASGDGHHWSLLPPLPVAGTSEERRGILQVLGVLSDGRLAAWGADPQTGVPIGEGLGKPMEAFWLWLWDPAAGKWSVVATPLNVSANEGCGLCWQAAISSAADGGTYLYAANFDVAAPGESPAGLFRLRLP